MRTSTVLLLATALALGGASAANAQDPEMGMRGERVIRHPGAAVHIGPTGLRVIQRSLRREGYDVPINGQMGPMTRRAIREFQRDQGLPVTGVLNVRTLRTLGIEVPLGRGGVGGPELRERMRERLKESPELRERLRKRGEELRQEQESAPRE